MAYEHTYFVALEVQPVQADYKYDQVPLHCTIMPRFRSNFDFSEIADSIAPVFLETDPVLLHAQNQSQYGDQANPVTANSIMLTDHLRDLHTRLAARVAGIEGDVINPEWILDGYKPHVTQHGLESMPQGSKHLAQNAYLAEVHAAQYPGKKIIRSIFPLEWQ